MDPCAADSKSPDTQPLRVPWGLRVLDGFVLSPEDATRGGEYRCPGCGRPIILRAGERVRPHFAHLHHADDVSCAPETLLHRTAKALVAQTIVEIATGADARHIRLECQCKRCIKPYWLTLPSNVFDAATTEHVWGAFRVDAMGLREGHAKLAIEIRVTHAVDAKKRINLSLPWIELDAQAVLEDRFTWRPLRASLKNSVCTPCRAYRQSIRERCVELQIELPEGAELEDPDRPYAAALVDCWRCKSPTVVFRWRDAPFAQYPPPEPRPRTIQWRYSGTWGGQYWMNSCGHCGASSGDNHLYRLGNAPFAGYPQRSYPREQDHSRSIVDQFLSRTTAPLWAASSLRRNRY
jgi:hypothetical protein